MPNELEDILPCARHAALAQELAALADLGAAPALAERCSAHLRDLATRDLDGRLLTRLISSFNDRLVERVIELTARRHRLPAVAWCWLALGSEGRDEQTFVSDQDNGLVFSAADRREADALRELFLPFARDVNQQLAACGFALCSGGIMAGNPAWCLALDEWREQFIEWVRRPDPQALLNASIFFDLRPLCGTLALGAALRKLLQELTADTPAFLRMMAANALQVEVPLSFRGELVATGKGAAREIDLKKFGSRIFVDVARIFALGAGTDSVNTSRRLQEAGSSVGLQAQELAAVDAAFSHILRLRLNHQAALGAAATTAGHGVPLAGLHDIDRALLKESLKHAGRLQQRLKLNYDL